MIDRFPLSLCKEGNRRLKPILPGGYDQKCPNPLDTGQQWGQDGAQKIEGTHCYPYPRGVGHRWEDQNDYWQAWRLISLEE
jgi:hypothetical protein